MSDNAIKLSQLQSAMEKTAEGFQNLKPQYMPDMYYTEYVREEIVPATTLEALFEEDGINVFAYEGSFLLSDGANVVINWNGTEYSCTANESEGTFIIGNLAILGEGEDTGEPFITMVMPEVGAEIYGIDGATSVTLSITANVNKVHTLDTKYHPPIPCLDLISLGAPKITGAAQSIILPGARSIVREGYKLGALKVRYEGTAYGIGGGELSDANVESTANIAGQAVGTPNESYELTIIHGAALVGISILPDDTCTMVLRKVSMS